MRRNTFLNRLFHFYKDCPLSSRAAIWFTICNILVKGIAFFASPIFSRILPDEEYGVSTLYASYQQIILILVTWEIQMGAYQKGLFNFKNDIKHFTISTQALANIITLTFFLFWWGIFDYVEKLTQFDRFLYIALLIFSLVQPSYNCWLVRKRTNYEYKSAFTITILYSLCSIICPVVGVFLLGKTAKVKFGTELIGLSFFCCFFFFKNVNPASLLKKWEKTKQYWFFLIKFEGPLVFHSLSYLILNQADRIMIGHYCGGVSAAYYSAAYNLSSIVTVLQGAINQALLPWRYKMLEEQNYTALRKKTNTLLIFVGIFAVLFILVAPDIFGILYCENYMEALWCIPPIVLSGFFIFLYSIFVNIESYYEKTNYVMYVSIFCAMLNIVMNYFGIHSFGYWFCGYSTLLCYIIFALGHFSFMNKVLHSKKIEEKLVDKTTLTICISVFLGSILASVGYLSKILRHGMLLIAIIMLILNKNRLFAKFNS